MERTSILKLKRKEELKKAIVSSNHSIVTIYKNGNWRLEEGDFRKEKENEQIYSLKCNSGYNQLELSNIIEWLDHIVCITNKYKEDHFFYTYDDMIESETVPLENYLYNPLPTIKQKITWSVDFSGLEWNHGLKLFRLFNSDSSFISFTSFDLLISYLYHHISSIKDDDLYYRQCKNIRTLHSKIFKTSIPNERLTQSNIEDNIILEKDELLRMLNQSKHTTVAQIYDYLELPCKPCWSIDTIISPYDINLIAVSNLIKLKEINKFFEKLYEERKNFDEPFVRQYIRLKAQSHKRRKNSWIEWRNEVDWKYASKFIDINHYLIAMDEITKAEVEIFNMAPCFENGYLKLILRKFENQDNLIKVTDVLSYFNRPIPSNKDISNKYFSLTLFDNDDFYDFMGFISIDEVIELLLFEDSSV
ncbi:hypothetical protein [Ornithinibacillus contaminans]|uniref:hypothetical protein n=1 Tax=Ornithinibacillus contaminans TaxID=694055 RepID=UPI00064D7302|nr:hypothetical protein [Ornithinibacillus contaminans]